MPRRSDKHDERAKKLEFDDFSGGEVYGIAAESLQKNEAQVLRNFEYDIITGHPRSALPYEEFCDVGATINDVFADENLDYFLAVCGTGLKKIPLSTGQATDIEGTLTGNKAPTFAVWDQNPIKVLIASGKELQIYNGSVLSKNEDSPDCDIVFVRGTAGRVVTARSGYDALVYSAVGDCESSSAFTDDPNDDSTSKEIEVGYKDSGDIVAVLPMASDLVVFKSSGGIYRIVGEYPDWALKETLSKVPLVARDAALRVGNDVIYLSPSGIRSLEVVAEYGDMLQKTVSEKVDRHFASITNSGARIWHLPSRGQVAINPNGSSTVWLLHLSANKAWSHFNFGGNITKIFEHNKVVYMVSGTKIYRQTTPTSQTMPVRSVMKLKRTVFDNDVVLKRVVMNIQPFHDATGSLMVAGLSIPFITGAGGDVAYSDTDIAYSDTDPLYVMGEKLATKPCNIRTKILEPELVVTSGVVSVRKITLYYAEG